ncbi:MAG: hypothetical protein FD171_777 [Actinobacteria bacterium]|nr:MAG: hypothetical protein FD171_777 [Actinomycetota bacterium]
MSAARARASLLLLATSFLLVVLAGQYAGDSIMGAQSSTATVAAVGRASTSYLTGIRTYAAAVLWNRIEPLLHGYYDGVPLTEQRYMLSTIALVEWLSPSFAPAYYVGPWILIRNDKVAEGMAMAKAGVEQAPDSGMCRQSYAQLLVLESKDLRGAVVQATAALGPGIVWADATEQVNAYASLEQIFRQAGETAQADFVKSEIDRIDASIENSSTEDVHDHNGDGVSDH